MRATDPEELESLKEKFRSGQLRLDAYLQRLVEVRSVREEDQKTSTGTRAERVRPPGFPGRRRSAPPAPRQVPRASRPAHAAPAVIPAPLTVGAVLGGRFELVSRVAAGGTATVWRANDRLVPGQPVPVALKVLHPDVVADPALLGAVLRAAAGMRTLRHPHIEQVLEVHEFGSERAIVTEWLEGESLAARLDRGGPLPAADVQSVVRDLADALEFAHDKGIVHGDLKPGNVFLGTDGRVCLLDFGFGEPRPKEDAGTTPAGVTGVYASAELLEGREPVPRDDIYAFACLTYRLVANARPYGLLNALDAEAARAGTAARAVPGPVACLEPRAGAPA